MGRVHRAVISSVLFLLMTNCEELSIHTLCLKETAKIELNTSLSISILHKKGRAKQPSAEEPGSLCSVLFTSAQPEIGGYLVVVDNGLKTQKGTVQQLRNHFSGSKCGLFSCIVVKVCLLNPSSV